MPLGSVPSLLTSSPPGTPYQVLTGSAPLAFKPLDGSLCCVFPIPFGTRADCIAQAGLELRALLLLPL